MTIKLAVNGQTCEIIVRRQLLSRLSTHLLCRAKPYSSVALIAAAPIMKLYGEAVIDEVAELEVPCHPILVPDGERAKTVESAEHAWKAMHAYGLDRNALVIGLGGGAATDLAGFVAASYMRGVRLIHIPTTLLAMVDAAIGGKTGVNFEGCKNMIGAFYQPTKVLADPDCLATLPPREFVNGMAEVIKYGVIADPELFVTLEQMEGSVREDLDALELIIKRCAELKGRIVEADEREANRRAILNWGHTFGHALESLSGMELTHGEAVAIGMSCAAHLSQMLGLVDEAFIVRQDRLIQNAGLPIRLPSSIDLALLLALMRKDKKAAEGGITCIVAEAIGQVRIERNVKESVILQALESKSAFDRAETAG